MNYPHEWNQNYLYLYMYVHAIMSILKRLFVISDPPRVILELDGSLASLSLGQGRQKKLKTRTGYWAFEGP